MERKKSIKILITCLIVFAVIAVLIGSAALIYVFYPSHGTPSKYYWDANMTFDPENTDFVTTFDIKHDGDIKILAVTDLQISELKGFGTAHEVLKEVVESTKPDLIVHTGDLFHAPGARVAIPTVVKWFDELGIPWANVLGNHELDAKHVDRDYIVEELQKSKYCLMQKGPANLEGIGNYVLNLRQNGDVKYSLILMDSGSRFSRTKFPTVDFPGKKKTDYPYIADNQINWYNWNVEGIKKTYGGNVKSMLFMHIPVPEYLTAWDLAEDGSPEVIREYGVKGENVASSAYNNGFFDAIVKGGNTTDIFVGHDHVNAWRIKYKGVWLNYVTKTGDCCYYDPAVNGATLIKIDALSRGVTVENILVK